MTYLIVKALLSGLIIAVASGLARRYPGAGALIVSLPLVSVLTMIWLWRDTGDGERLSAHAEATFWYVLPTLPMFLAIPWLIRSGVGFWPALGLGCALTIVLYLLTVFFLSRMGIGL